MKFPSQNETDYDSSVVKKTINQEDIESYEEAAKFINKEAYGAVILQHEFGIMPHSLALCLISNVKTRVITNIHTVQRNMPEERHGLLYNVVLQSHKSVVMTESMRWTLDVYHAIAPEDIVVIPHGSLIIPQEKLGQFSMYPGKRIIISNGLIHKAKGYEYAIRAMQSVVKDFPNAIYIIQGIPHPVGAEVTKVYYQSLKDLVKELNLEETVIFRSDYVNENELIQILSSCDLYINPYIDKSQAVSGTVAMAMGAGLPIISTPYPYAVEVITASRGGILVPFQDEVSIAMGIKSMLGNEMKMKEYKENARKFAEQRSWNSVGKRYVNMLNNLKA